MRFLSCGLVIVCLSAAGFGAAQDSDPAAGEPAAVVQLACSPVGTVWPASASGSHELAGPKLSVVMTDLRPKDGRLYLDGRFIGRARYFNGRKGLLFLEPGRYRMECRYDGYRTEAFEIDARPNCRFNLKHRMTRQPGVAKERRNQPPGRGIPAQRVFGSVKQDRQGEPPQQPGRADVSLRPDLTRGAVEETPARTSAACLELRVRPATASVYLDGVFVATGEELEAMVECLAIEVGPHELKVTAPGYSPRSKSFEAPEGESVELVLVLTRS